MKKSFYLKYIENKERGKKDNKIKQKYKLDDNTIIIEKSSNFFVRLLRIIVNAMKSAFKGILYILVMILVSIGITVIVNANIRQIFINSIWEGINL